MSDYISRQAAEDAMTQSVCGDTWEVEKAMEAVRQLPAADVVPVVRCRDCKYVRKFRSEESAKKFGQVYECVRYTIPCPNPTDFCSYGKRKE